MRFIDRLILYKGGHHMDSGDSGNGSTTTPCVLFFRNTLSTLKLVGG